MKNILPYVVSILLLAMAAFMANYFMGPELAPEPGAVITAWWKFAISGELFHELGYTLMRGLAGIILANIAGVVLGLAAGMIPGVLRMISPLVAALQACPAIVWITLLMVWAGTGSSVPVATVFAVTFPFVFSSTAQGMMGLDKRLFAMSRLYAVPKIRMLRLLILPGIWPYWLAAFSTVLAAGWKAAAVAEFLGSHEGIGARIFWSYRKLNMEDLNAWALTLILLGVLLECAVILPLRRKAASMEAKGVSADA